MDEKCGFKSHNLCQCEDMECYDKRCTYIDAIMYCPVHFDPDEAQEGLRSQMIKNNDKKEVDNLKEEIELRDKMIDRLTHQIVDPWFDEINVREYLQEYYPDDEDLIIYDGFDEAFIGVGYTFHTSYTCYDKQKIINILMDRDCMTEEEAEEYFEFNIAGLYAGKKTPIILECV